MPPQNLSRAKKFFLLCVIGLLAFALIDATNSTTAHSQTKRQLDNRVPSHLPIKVNIKKEHQEGFEDLNHEHWPWNFVLEVKNTGDRPIYALSLVWMLPEVKIAGNHYGSTLMYGRHEFITTLGARPEPEDVPIKPGDIHVFKLSKMTAEGLESLVTRDHLPTPSGVTVLFNFLCFGDDTGWHSPGRTFNRNKP